MTMFSLHTELLHGVTTDPRGGWSLPSALVLAGVLAAVLIGGAFATPRSASIGETVAPELPSVTTIISTSRTRRAAPGFASWPKRELRVAEASPRN